MFKHGSIDRSMWKFYQIPMFAGHEALDIRVTSIIGRVDNITVIYRNLRNFNVSSIYAARNF